MTPTSSLSQIPNDRFPDIARCAIDRPIKDKSQRRSAPRRLRMQPSLILDEQSDPVEAFWTVWTKQASNTLTKGGLSHNYCMEVQDRFENSSARIARHDGVPGDEIGATQFGKLPVAYMAKAAQTREEVYRVLGDWDGEIPQLMRRLAQRLDRGGFNLRPLTHDGEPASRARLVRWTTDADAKRWLLRPHDDLAQTRGYENWELSRVERVIALNFYLNSVAGSGQLAVTAWRPTDEDRRVRGLEKSGYPYEDDDLLTRPHIILPVSTSDICFIDGATLHGVLIGEGRVASRLIANLFVGQIGKTAIYWA